MNMEIASTCGSAGIDELGLQDLDAEEVERALLKQDAPATVCAEIHRESPQDEDSSSVLFLRHATPEQLWLIGLGSVPTIKTQLGFPAVRRFAGRVIA